LILLELLAQANKFRISEKKGSEHEFIGLRLEARTAGLSEGVSSSTLHLCI